MSAGTIAVLLALVALIGGVGFFLRGTFSRGEDKARAEERVRTAAEDAKAMQERVEMNREQKEIRDNVAQMPVEDVKAELKRKQKR